MAGSNSNFQLAGTDFEQIKGNLITYLKGQNILTDANYTGSALSILLDILAYNTYYNATYLNLIGSELFLDSAIKRSSVVSKAKELGYVPASATSAQAIIDLSITGLQSTTFVLPKYSRFISGQVNNKTYTFITTQQYSTIVDSNGNGTISDITIYEGEPVTYNFTYIAASNPNSTFNIPDVSVDIDSLIVGVQQSSVSSNTTIFTKATNYLNLDSTSTVYFIQEASDGTYDIYFGDGILGTQLIDGNIVSVTYISTSGSAGNGIQNFKLVNVPTATFTRITANTTQIAFSGGDKESIDSIKFQAPKAYASQNRAVTKDDYINLIQKNSLQLKFDAVNVWGGEENSPPVYGQVFVCLKPKGAYTLTDTQKTRLINDVIKPISVMTVEPTIIDPDYTYVKLDVNVVYNQSKTVLAPSDINALVVNAINNYANTNLNTFNSIFSSSDLINQIQNVDQSIIANELSVQLQKKIYPNLTTPSTYNFYYGVPLAKGMFQSGVSSSPAVQFRNPLNLAEIIDGIYVEEIPSSTGGIESISLINAGYSYQYTPTVAILGDGTGATAEAIINNNGTINSINVLTSGNNYTSAIVTITPASGDVTGTGAAAIPILQGQYGTLRTYYNNNAQVKTIFNPNAGTIDYVNGIITLNSFGPIDVDNPLGQLAITANPKTTIISSSMNRIITIDPFDPNAITVTVTAK
jgi:hypothetical protein